MDVKPLLRHNSAIPGSRCQLGPMTPTDVLIRIGALKLVDIQLQTL